MKRTLLVDIAAIAILSAMVWVACYDAPGIGVPCTTPLGQQTVTASPEACAELAAVEARALPVWLDAGLTRLSRLAGVALELHPLTDGGSWPAGPAGRDAGFGVYFGDATRCTGTEGAPRWVTLASLDMKRQHAREVLCHEGGHCLSPAPMFDHPGVARLPDGGSPCTDEYLFCRTKLDAKCAEAMKD